MANHFELNHVMFCTIAFELPFLKEKCFFAYLKRLICISSLDNLHIIICVYIGCYTTHTDLLLKGINRFIRMSFT